MKHADIKWQQGQPFSSEFEDVYFSREGGLAETVYVFLQHNHLQQRWKDREQFVIAETGFGTGLNFLTTAQHWLKQAGQQARLHFISIEKAPLRKADLNKALSNWPELEILTAELLENYPPAVNGLHHIPLFDHRVVLTLAFGDVEHVLAKLHARVDAWYLDGFAPDKNPDMWQPTVFKQVARLSRPGTTFSTFTAAGDVRRGLKEAGFTVEKVKGYGNKREMLRGALDTIPVSQTSLPWYALPKHETKSRHAVIIGAGIAGISTAHSLARQGWTIDILEREDSIAQGGSGNPLAVVMPRFSLGDNPDCEFYNTAFFKAVRELNALKQRYPELNWQQGGVLQLAHSARIQNQLERLDCTSELAQAVSAEQASEIAGVEMTTPALYFPQAGWVDPAQLCRLLLDDAGRNIRLHLSTGISSLEYSHGHWQLFDTHHTPLMDAETLILANAGAACQFTETGFLPLQHARGQISIVPATQSSKPLRCVICHDGYILPESDGRHVIGASFLDGETSTAPDPAEDAQNVHQQRLHLPGLFSDIMPVLDQRAALRATTPDRLPILGPVMDEDFFNEYYSNLNKGKPAANYPVASYLEGLYINAGHGARGLTSAFLSAEVISSMVNNEPLAVTETIWQALSPSRFTVRDLKHAR